MQKLVVLGLGASVAWGQDDCGPQRIVPPTEFAAVDFGQVVAIDERHWIIADNDARTLCGGEPLACSTGAVHAFELVGEELVLRQSIVPADIRLHDKFGNDVDVDGDTLVVGVRNKRWAHRPGSVSGAAYIYEHDGEQWVEAHRVEPPTDVSGFGRLVAIDGDMVWVTPGQLRGISVFDRGDTGWDYRETLTPPDGLDPVDIQFGFSWAIGEQWAFVGAHKDGSVDAYGGSVYVYRRGPDDRLEFVQKIDTPEPGSSDRFGIGLDFDGRTLAAGSWWATSPLELQGAVYTYELDGDTWTLRQKILHEDPQEQDGFGRSLVVSGDHMVAQAPGRARPGSRESIFHFTRGADGLWRQAREIVPTPPEWMQKYGNTMATDGRYALIGASDDEYGTAYLFDLECGACPVDLDADGALTVFDFLAFLNLFEDGDAAADFDGDGELTIFDFLAFQTAFEAGCA